MPIVSSGSGGGSGGGATILFDSGYLAGAAATIDSGAGGFSTAFLHLRVVAILRGDTAAATVFANVTLNNDSGANYDGQIVNGVAAAAAAAEALGGTSMQYTVPAGTATASKVGIIVLWLPFYANTFWHKQIALLNTRSTGTGTGQQVVEADGRTWRSTAAVTRITFAAAAGNFAANNRVVVYGEN